MCMCVWWFHRPSSSSSFCFALDEIWERNRMISLSPYPFFSHSQSHLYFIWWEALEETQSYIDRERGRERSNDVLFNHARDCDRAERNNRWNDSYERTIRYLETISCCRRPFNAHIYMYIWETHTEQTDTKHFFLRLVLFKTSCYCCSYYGCFSSSDDEHHNKVWWLYNHLDQNHIRMTNRSLQ